MDQSWFIITKQEIIMEILINDQKVDDSIRFEFVPNPKKKHGKSYQRYEVYQHCTSLSEYLLTVDQKYGRPDLRYDESHGYLKLFDKEGNHLNPKVPPITEVTEQKKVSKKK